MSEFEDVMRKLEVAKRQAVANSALAIACSEGRFEWPGWVVYLLERLEERSNQSEVSYPDDMPFQWVLERIRDRINTRLETGSW